jgi:hypothetical protein
MTLFFSMKLSLGRVVLQLRGFSYYLDHYVRKGKARAVLTVCETDQKVDLTFCIFGDHNIGQSYCREAGVIFPENHFVSANVQKTAEIAYMATLSTSSLKKFIKSTIHVLVFYV